MLKSELSKNLDEIMLMIHNCAYINEKQSEVISTLRRLISYYRYRNERQHGILFEPEKFMHIQTLQFFYLYIEHKRGAHTLVLMFMS